MSRPASWRTSRLEWAERAAHIDALLDEHREQPRRHAGRENPRFETERGQRGVGLDERSAALAAQLDRDDRNEHDPRVRPRDARTQRGERASSSSGRMYETPPNAFQR